MMRTPLVLATAMLAVFLRRRKPGNAGAAGAAQPPPVVCAGSMASTAPFDVDRPRPPRKGARPVRVVRLSQRDFRSGPYIASAPDTELILAENVYVNFPLPMPPGTESPFHLGWFGAIVVAAPRVTLRLNGKTLAMHPSFRTRQRFFSLVSLDLTPFPPEAEVMGFTTEPVRPTDVAILGPGTLGLTSHFCVHGNTLRGETRILISDVRMQDYEVGAISLSGASDVLIRRCSVGRPVPPTETSDVLMLKHLSISAREHGAEAEAVALAHAATQAHRSMGASDAICRAIVINPHFNVNEIPTTFPKRIERIAIEDCTFERVFAEPIEVVGMAMPGVDQRKAVIKDRNGNLIAYDDVGSLTTRLQAAYNERIPWHVRKPLMNGRMPRLKMRRVRGLDRRGHSLQGKSSLLVRVDGATHVSLHNLSGTSVESAGPEAAACGFMLNGCHDVSLRHLKMHAGVHVRGTATDSLSDERPRAGLLLRRCRRVRLIGYTYSSGQPHHGVASACASACHHVTDASFSQCSMSAPSTFLHCADVSMR